MASPICATDEAVRKLSPRSARSTRNTEQLHPHREARHAAATPPRWIIEWVDKPAVAERAKRASEGQAAKAEEAEAKAEGEEAEARPAQEKDRRRSGRLSRLTNHKGRAQKAVRLCPPAQSRRQRTVQMCTPDFSTRLNALATYGPRKGQTTASCGLPMA